MTPFRYYLPVAVENGPAVLRALMAGLSLAEATYRPEADRFTIQEAVAHLADFEPIFRERIMRTMNEDHPSLPGVSEDELAEIHDYTAKDVWGELATFEAERAITAAYVRTIPEEAWTRTANRIGMGVWTMVDMVGVLPVHDSYHLHQVIEWREKFSATSGH